MSKVDEYAPILNTRPAWRADHTDGPHRRWWSRRPGQERDGKSARRQDGTVQTAAIQTVYPRQTLPHGQTQQFTAHSSGGPDFPFAKHERGTRSRLGLPPRHLPAT